MKTCDLNLCEARGVKNKAFDKRLLINAVLLKLQNCKSFRRKKRTFRFYLNFYNFFLIELAQQSDPKTYFALKVLEARLIIQFFPSVNLKIPQIL